MRDRTSPFAPVEEQVQRVLAASVALAQHSVLLGVALQAAWLDAWMRAVLEAQDACRTWRTQQERRTRLVRRGVPDQLARQGLRLVPGAGR
ncbi:hypothetical protein M446_5182 [Methylobacterium sp. 4-46]|uniref:hypothetical protein n=1 Tax=unclassified Methylobacterium TaxID=2615210 RepID=UPI000165CDFF|nr:MULTISPECIES: hypothetical protein [Methylobacterium]ACA19507.1 hypothetical protein M446_5182 [Methylobacterium sp. 4-46]WFT78703.1 hypothetical protein QA634_26065 [Methylobacterium nodulans]